MFNGISKSEIEEELQRKGDFVQIDYLTRFLESRISRDVKRFIYLKLAELYEKELHEEIDSIYKRLQN